MVHPDPNSLPSSALDSSSSRATSVVVLSEAAERALTRALHSQARPPLGMFFVRSDTETRALDRAVDEICADAHRLELRAEELLIGIKEAWSQLAELRARHLGDRDGDVLREVVSHAIAVFYEERDGPPAAQR